jgi:hypothetical protein
VATENKVKEGNLHVDVEDEDYRRVEKKLRNAQDLDAKDTEVISKMKKAKRETDDLDKMFKMDSAGVPNESKVKESKALMRIPKAWFTPKIRESISKMLLKEGFSALQIVDAEGTVVADAEEQDIEPSNIKDFLLKNMDDLELTEITPDIVKEYLLADEESTEEDMTKTPEVDRHDKVQGEAPDKSEEVLPGENVASEAKVREGNLSLRNELLKRDRLGNPDNYANQRGSNICPECGSPMQRSGCQNCGNKSSYESVKRLLEKFGLAELSINQLLEKFGLTQPITVESLLEKFQLNEADPVVFKPKPAVATPNKGNKGGAAVAEPEEDIRDKDLTGQAVTPADVNPEAAAPAAPISASPQGDTGAGAGPSMGGAPGGGEGTAEPLGPVSAQDMSTPESAKAYLQSEFPEEPFTSTAIAYADSLIADPKIYGAVRDTKWGGIWGDKETLEKQAKIVGEYGSFTPASMKSITDKFGNTAKYKLARDVRPVLYITVRDVGAGVEPISISELKGLSGAREVVATENPGEVKIIY